MMLSLGTFIKHLTFNQLRLGQRILRIYFWKGGGGMHELQSNVSLILFDFNFI